MNHLFSCKNNAKGGTQMKLAISIAALFASTMVLATAPGDKAIRIARDTIIVDTHIDVPYRIEDKWDDITTATSEGDFDYPRAVRGGLNAPFMSIYIPASYEESGGGDALADRLIDRVEAMVGRAPGKFQLAYTVADIERAFREQRIALPMGMENGTPIGGSFEKLQHFYDRGIRYITLAHSESNHIADSSYDKKRQWNGLSPFGKTLIPEMNRLGIMVDISHVTDEAFYQALAISKAPIIASHSSLRKFTPGFERNMSDKMLIALAEKGGVLQINFGSSFVTADANKWKKARDEEIERLGLEDSRQKKKFVKKFRVKHPLPYATLAQVLDHFDHAKNLVGIDHIGIGSDFDGVGDSLPTGLKDVSFYPQLIQGLLDRGYSEEDIAKILHGNILRVWKEVEQTAAQ